MRTILCCLVVVLAMAAVGQTGRSRRSGRSGAAQQQGAQKPGEEPLANFTGTIHAIDPKSLTVDGEDANSLQFLCSKKTRYYDGSKKIKASALKPGSHVSVEARHALDGSLEAVNVRLVTAGR